MAKEKRKSHDTKSLLSITDQELIDKWRKSAASDGTRQEVFQRTLALVLGINLGEVEARDFISEVWLSLATRRLGEIPQPPRPGVTVLMAVRVGLRLKRLSEARTGEDERLVLQISKKAMLAERREQNRTLREVEGGQRIYDAVEKEKTRNGARGATTRAAKALKKKPEDPSSGTMTPQNVGKRYREWKNLGEEAAKGSAIMTEFRARKKTK